MERPLADWLTGLPAAASVNTPRAFLGYAIECLLDVRDGTGWDSEYQRDVWRLRRLGVADHDGARLDFTVVQPLWLRELAKRWCRWRMSCGVGLGQLRKDRIALVRLSRLTPGLASSTDPQRVRPRGAGGLSGPTAGRAPTPKDPQHRYRRRDRVSACRAPAPLGVAARGGAAVSQRPAPRRGETPAPRAIPEFVMGQLEGRANLDRIADPRFRLLVEILIRTGLRIGDATRLALDCLVRDPQGAVYLRYRNHKMRRDAVVPIDDELTAMIQTQQERTRQQFPTTGVLLPRGSANPDGRLPIPTATFHFQLGQWLETCGVTNELGEPVHVTAHQFRHTAATRWINHEVPQEVVRRLLDHTSHTMTAVYARLADTTIREQWERAQKINIRGEPIDTTIDGTLADGEWMKQNLARAKMALPNGYCGLPLQKSCPHANACLTCPLFVTTAEFLPPTPQAARRHPRADHPRPDRRPHPPGRDEPHRRNQPAHHHHHPRCRPTRLPVRRSRQRNMLREGIIQCAMTIATTSSPLPNAAAPTPSNGPAMPYTNSAKLAGAVPSPRSPPTPESPAHGSTPSPNCATNSAD